MLAPRTKLVHRQAPQHPPMERDFRLCPETGQSPWSHGPAQTMRVRLPLKIKDLLDVVIYTCGPELRRQEGGP